MSAQATILVADDDASIRTVLSAALERAGYAVRLASNASTLWQWISQGEGDLVITDVLMEDENIFDLLPEIKKQRPNLPLIVMSAQRTLMTAITAAERGAYEYLPKPFDLDELIRIVAQALQKSALAIADRQIANVDKLPLIGRSTAMQDIYRSLARLMKSDLAVLITGESGTGKELVARALHDYGIRKGHPFIAVNMAAIPKELIESELFGHEKGAFTGATSRHAGHFAKAETGTLFLDEIGDMPREAQTRLLRVLQEGEYTPVGSNAPVKSDLRIIAATHQDLQHLIRQGRFREDLFYRLNVVPLEIPPLRKRFDDLPELVEHFFRQGENQNLPAKKLDREAMECLRSYSWPGNIRELENLIHRLSVLYTEDVIKETVIKQELKRNKNYFDLTGESQPGETLETLIERYLADYFSKLDGKLPPEGFYQRLLEQFERPLLAHSLTATRGNQLQAARILGLNRNTLRKKIKDLGVEVTRLPKN